MELGHWIAIGIVVLAIITLVVGVVLVMNRISGPIKNLQALQEEANDKMTFYEGEVNYLEQEMNRQMEAGQRLADQAQRESNKITRLSHEGKQLQSTLSYIGSIKGDVAQTAVDEGKAYIKEDLPRRANKWKRIAQKTLDKQKARYSNANRTNA